MKDKKLLKKIFIPVGLILLVYGIAVLSFVAFFDLTGRLTTSPSLYAYTLVIVVLGGYFTERGFDIRTRIDKVLNEVKAYSEEARVMFISTIVSIGIFLVGIASTYSILYDLKMLPLDRRETLTSMYSLVSRTKSMTSSEC